MHVMICNKTNRSESVLAKTFRRSITPIPIYSSWPSVSSIKSSSWLIPFDLRLKVKDYSFIRILYRVSAKRTLRCIFRPDAARRLVFLGQFYMVLIDHISQNQLHASTCRLEKNYMVECWKKYFYFPFLSFPILNHVKFGIFFPRLLHC